MWNKEKEAGLNEWSVRVAERNSQMSRDLIAKLKQDADELEARIKQVAEMEENGFYLCEKGHEFDSPVGPNCPQCMAPTPFKFIKRSDMTGQEKYESDKGRKEAEDLLKARREEIAGKETNCAWRIPSTR